MGSNVGSISSISVVVMVVTPKSAVRKLKGLNLNIPYFVTLTKHISFHRLSIYYVRTR
jgi:hypothetical protein